MACPSGLFFDITTKQCDNREQIVACGGTQPIQPAPLQPVAAPAAPYSRIVPAQPIPAAAPAISVSTVEKFCSGKVDGIYAEGCPSFYHNCVSGYTYKVQLRHWKRKIHLNNVRWPALRDSSTTFPPRDATSERTSSLVEDNSPSCPSL